ncbi:type IV toxin-antitoxin system AbiEi family antitoxin [Haloechinothrix alba]|nr:type IV toxin-antitoxin system AbiEi family antitoxin [Haloechinothrix alba]
MPRRSAVDWDAVASAAEHDILTRHELHTLGVTQKMIWARTRAGGPWSRVLPGVIMLRNGAPTRRQRLCAALRYGGAEAIVSGASASRLHGLRHAPETDQVHLLVPHGAQPNSCGYVLVERTTRMPRVVYRDGVPTAEVTRAVLDAARRMSGKDAVEAVLAESVQRGLTTPRRLSTELEAGSDRGSALPRAVLRAITRGARSVPEADAVRLVARAHLPQPEWNVRVRLPGRGTPLVPDAWFGDVGLAWEIDSYQWHLSPADYARTLERHAAMTGAGIVVLHTLPARLRSEPGAVIAELRAAYEHAARCPAPDVYVDRR